MKGKEILKRSGGITLIALVITIIVLLILAGVTIATLTGDNGLLSKASSAKNTVNEAEIEEKIKLAYQDYYLGQHTEAGYTFQNAVDKMFGTGVATVTESKGVYTVSFTNGKTYKFYSETGTAEEFNDPFSYGTKTKETVVAGDVISLKKGSIDERFTVVSNKNGVVVAIPHYNLVETSDRKVKQGPAVGGTSTEISSLFSNFYYWAYDEQYNEINGWNDDSKVREYSVDIDMTGKDGEVYKNDIQQYIDAYKETLEGMGVKGIIVRVCTKPELSSELGAELDTPLTDAQKQSIRNPGKTGNFWLGSAVSDSPVLVNYVNNDGNISYGDFTIKKGVRPVIEIH